MTPDDSLWVLKAHLLSDSGIFELSDDSKDDKKYWPPELALGDSSEDEEVSIYAHETSILFLGEPAAYEEVNNEDQPIPAHYGDDSWPEKCRGVSTSKRVQC